MKTKTIKFTRYYWFLFLSLTTGLLWPLAAIAQECGSNNPLGIEVGCRAKPGENVIFTYLAAIIRFLAAGVGIVIVLAIIIAGIRYIISSGNPQALQDAKTQLAHAVFALLMFIFMFAALNFLIPGGLIR